MGFSKSKTTNMLILVVVILCVGREVGATRSDTIRNLLYQLRCQQEDPYIRAECNMMTNPVLSDDVKAANDINGKVSLKQLKTGGNLMVSVDLSGIDATSANQHGFHVHASGDITTNGCSSTGGHYNPLGKSHGGPADSERHVGDFGNVERSSDGSVLVDFTDNVASLLGQHSIIGRAIVLHQDTDDLGRGGHSDSLTTGHAGARLACCVITKID